MQERDVGNFSIKTSSILVVDDSSVLRCAYKKVLEGWGCAVDVAEDGLQGMDLIARKNYKIVITDYEMPNCDGIEFLARVRAGVNRSGDIPFILVTGTPLDVLSGCLDGFECVLEKPVGLRALRDVVDRFIVK